MTGRVDGREQKQWRERRRRAHGQIVDQPAVPSVRKSAERDGRRLVTPRHGERRPARAGDDRSLPWRLADCKRSVRPKAAAIPKWPRTPRLPRTRSRRRAPLHGRRAPAPLRALRHRSPSTGDIPDLPDPTRAFELDAAITCSEITHSILIGARGAYTRARAWTSGRCGIARPKGSRRVTFPTNTCALRIRASVRVPCGRPWADPFGRPCVRRRAIISVANLIVCGWAAHHPDWTEGSRVDPLAAPIFGGTARAAAIRHRRPGVARRLAADELVAPQIGVRSVLALEADRRACGPGVGHQHRTGGRRSEIGRAKGHGRISR
jgi:hypothetical protein